MLDVAVVVGSIRRESINRRLAGALLRLAEGKLAPVWVRIDDLPLFNQDDESQPLPAVERFKGEIRAADGLLFVTPEHNRSIPSALKNAIDWATRPPGTNVLAGKPAAVIGTSQGAIGTALAQQHLKQVLLGHTAGVMGRPEAYIQYKRDLVDDSGAIADESTRRFLQGFVDSFAGFVSALKQR
jgi:chromate reductase